MSVFTQKGQLHAKDYLVVLLRHWRVSVVTFVLCVMGAWYVNLVTPPLYVATATLMINPDLPQAILGNTNNPYLTEMNEDLSIETQLRVIQSDPVAEGVARRLNLVDEDKDPQGFQDFVVRIKRAVAVERMPGTRLFDIKATSNKGQEAADVANSTAEVFIEQSLQSRFDASRRSIAWLTDQIIDMRKKLEDSEKALAEFRSKENIVGGEMPSDVKQQRMADLQGEFFGTQSKTYEIRGKIQQIQGLLAAKQIHYIPRDLSDSLDELARKMSQTELALERAKVQYKEKHPKVIEIQKDLQSMEDQARHEMKKVLENLQAQAKAAEGQERVFQDSLVALNKEALLQNDKQTQLKILKRDVETYQDLYNVLIKKLKTADLTRGVGESNYRIVEYAKNPHWPVRPRKRRNMMLGILVGMTFAIAVAYGFEYFDRTIRTPDDVTANLDMPILVTIPKVHGRHSAFEGDSIFLSKDRLQSLESIAFHALRTNLRFGQTDEQRKALLVTSTSPSEGKTTVAANLGISFANSGMRTLIVDTDLRKPRVHSIFDRPNDRGVSNCQPNDLRASIQHTAFENLDILTSGPHISSPFEFLEKEGMRKIVQEATRLYDQVLFDSPPIGSVVDASILATYVDGVIFVVRSGKVEPMHVQHAKEQLEKVNATLLGIVLNNLEQRFSRYYSNYYYYRGYYGDRAKDILKGIRESIQRI